MSSVRYLRLPQRAERPITIDVRVILIYCAVSPSVVHTIKDAPFSAILRQVRVYSRNQLDVGGSVTFRAMRLLCAGKELNLLETRCEVLRHSGYEARAATLREAENLLRTEDYDLVIISAYLTEWEKGRILTAVGKAPNYVLPGLTFASELLSQVEQRLPPREPSMRNVRVCRKDQIMDATGWDDVREEICTVLEIGMSKGETELETMTRFVWLERHNNLEAIENAVAAALAHERGLVTKQARVLKWKQPLRSGPF